MDTFVEISLVLAVAAVFSAAIRIAKQPVIIAYILTGLLVGPSVLNIIKTPSSLQVFSDFGVALLLFIIGLSLSLKVVREVGKVSLIAGFLQIIFTAAIGIVLVRVFNFSWIESIYLGIAFTFSSTIIILKLLSDKGDIEKLHAKISMGILLVQDVIVTIILIGITSTSRNGSISEIALGMIVRGAVMIAVFYIFARFILPKVALFFARSQEYLFLFSIAWGMGVASLFAVLGFSIEIGALFAGVTLSLFPYHYEMSAKLRPLRDFFLIMFFILLGLQLNIGYVEKYLLAATIFTIFILIAKPVIVLLVMKKLGYKKRVSFLTAVTMAQISEFSLLMIAMGHKQGHISGDIISIITLVGLFTITLSSYMILYSDGLYRYLSGVFKFLRDKKEDGVPSIRNYDVILFGYNRIGFDFVSIFKELKVEYLVVDFNPVVIEQLENQGVLCRYGDAGDVDLLEELNLIDVKMIVSTIPDFETNDFILEIVRKDKLKAIVLVVAHNIYDAKRLYKSGADYVIMPHFLGGKYASNMVMRYKFDRMKFEHEKENQLKTLTEREYLGHEHPAIRKDR
ncbi:hypothetical protein A2982_02695 [candidate division WWE3 bacterium RIFCSPLOWO2_01_FULL_39_13]|uniref:RCK N-terminal domain-containing protein n=1 Tax=candidate division WWE3 bacterium RIFCSPLOWO2_01_FULL_39_13 TaxID=1802624 RepID=A0A1F4V2P7_UNCKA|nr:MAG: hypothetical protein A2982_02695 [candidate division WWE3 bacterium RIFCSPLOWO2_01_FULL_39_13]